MEKPALLAEAAALDAELAGKAAAPAPGGVDADNAADSPGAATQPDQAPAAGIPLEQELAGTVALVGVTLGGFFPSVKPVLDEAKCVELGAALAPVVRKYPWLQQLLCGFAWRVELQAAMVVVPVVVAVRSAIRADLEAMKAPSSPAIGEPGATVVSSSTPIDTRGMLQPIDPAKLAPPS